MTEINPPVQRNPRHLTPNPFLTVHRFALTAFPVLAVSFGFGEGGIAFSRS
jgi:hypothetical protein